MLMRARTIAIIVGSIGVIFAAAAALGLAFHWISGYLPFVVLLISATACGRESVRFWKAAEHSEQRHGRRTVGR